MIGTDRSWAAGIETRLRPLSLAALIASVSFATVFSAWAALAPLAGASVAQGFVTAAGQNQRVQHLEGGIIRDILVREGEQVSAGQPLYEMDPTEAMALQSRLDKQMVALRARAARLGAERSGLAALTFDPALESVAAENGLTDLLAEQRNEFDARFSRSRQEKAILGESVASLREEIKGMEAQQTAVETQLGVVRDEAGRKRSLLDKGLTNRSEYSTLMRSEADLLGQLGQSKASILSARTKIAEYQEQTARLDTQRVETALTELNDIRSQISDAEERSVAAKAVVDRSTVRAPADGIVVKVAVNSVGSVVRPGDTLLELLPTSEDPVVEARIAPKNVDIVSVGQTARLRFSALDTRMTPTVDATVTYLSADRLLDPNEKQPYYLARLKIAADLPAGISRRQIYPGMPVETYINTGDRTFFEYLTKPVTDSLSRAFREQ